MKNIIRCIGKLVPDTNKTYNLLYCIAFISLFFTMHAFADTSVEIKKDPTKAEESSITYSDTRLNQKVTYTAENKSVRDVLSDLTKMTGISFFSGTNSKDWLVRDRKLIIFVKDVPLGSLKESIASVLKMKWKESGDADKILYRLFQDKKTLTEEEDRQNKIIEAARLEHYGKCKQALDNMINTANMSQGQLENLREKDPYLYLLGTTGIANAIKSLVTEVPDANSSLLGGDPIEIPNSLVTPNLRKSIAKALDGFGELYSRVMKEDSEGLMTLKDNNSDIAISINCKFKPVEMSKGSMQSSMQSSEPGYVNLRIGNKNQSLPFMTQTKAFNILAKAALMSQEQSVKLVDVLKNMESEIKDVDVYEMIDISEQSVEHLNDPALLKEIQIKNKYDKLWEYLSALSKEANINIVSDSFGILEVPPHPKIIPSQKAAIQEYLDSIASRFSTNWENNNDIIEYRNKEWYKKCAALIPEEVINRWKDNLKSTGTLDFNDLSQIAMLEGNQKIVNIFSDEFLNSSKVLDYIKSIERSQFSWILSCYASMTDQQKYDFFSSRGVNLKAVGEHNQDYSFLLIRLISDAELISNNSIYISCMAQPQDYQYKCTVIIKNSDNEILSELNTLLPKYQLPVEKTKPVQKEKLDSK